MTKPLHGDEKKIGYGTPPQMTRYRKGQSGNPKGRPKMKAGNFALESVLNQRVKVLINGKERVVSLNEAVLRATAKRATSGDIIATKELWRLAESSRIKKEAHWQRQYKPATRTIFDPEGCEAVLESLGIIRQVNGRTKIEPWFIEAALAEKPMLHLASSDLAFVSWSSVDAALVGRLFNQRVN